MNVPLIDLYSSSLRICNSLGKDGCESISPPPKDGTPDTTHLNAKGSELIGRLVADELGKVVPQLAPYVKSAPQVEAASMTEIQKRSDGLVLTTQTGVMQLQVWSDRVIRVIHTPTVQATATKSLSVIADPTQTSWKLHESAEALIVETQAVRARIDRLTANVSFCDLNDKPILREAAGSEFTPTTMPTGGTSARQTFALAPDERIYGLGQHQDGIWNCRGTKVHLQQRNTQVAVPVLMSSRGYGVLWDNPAITDVEIGTAGNGQIVAWTSEAGTAVDYYFIYGPAADDVIRGYRQLTGAAPMMGKWVWGFWQCKERYKTQDELIGVATEYRKRGVPIDGVIQDWQYWKPGAWGSHGFDEMRFPDPAAMVKTLHEMNLHVLISVWPRFDVGTQNLAELEQAGGIYEPVFPNVYPKGQGKWYDAFNPEARRIYWKQISQRLLPLDFDGWWLDATEAELGGKWGEMRILKTSAGSRRNGAQCLSAYDDDRGVSRPARTNRPQTRLHPDSLGICRPATQRRDHLVR